MIPVRQSTAFETAIGPVLDADGVAVTGCVVGDFKIKKTTGNFAALDGSATLTHVSAGTYDLVLTTSDVDTVGLNCVAIDDTVNACQPLYLQVIEEAVYDALFAASAVGPLLANSDGSGLTAINLPNQTMDIVGNITGNLSGSVGTVTGLTASDVGDIKAKTDNLPSDPADASVIAGRFDTLDTSVADVESKVDDLETRLGTPSDLGGGATIAANLVDIESQTDDIGAAGAGLTAADDAILTAIATLNNLSSAQAQSAVTTALTAALTEGYRGTGATGSVRDLLYEIIAHLGESSISSTTKTINKLDGTTPAKTYTLDSATTPTAITETT
jgi:hypothetical protein